MHQDPKWVTVLGYIAGADIWEAFETDWQRVLGEYGIDMFHAREFFPSRKPYRTWSRVKRNDFLIDLLDVIGQQNITPVGRAVSHEAFMAQPIWFRRYLTGARLTTTGKFVYSGAPNDPYQMAMVELMIEALDEASDDDLVHFTMSQQDQMEGYTVGHMNRIRTMMEQQNDPRASKLGRASYSTPALDRGLQAADLLNHVVYVRLTRPLDLRMAWALRMLAKKRGTVITWVEQTFDAARDLVEARLEPEALARLQAIEK